MNARAAREVEEKARDPKFDLTVTHRDRMGKVTHSTPYRMFIIDEYRYFERPKFSKNLFYESGEPAGRLIEADEEHKDKRTGKMRKYRVPSVDVGAEHIAYEAPATADQKLAAEVGDVRSENAALRAELEALRAEVAAKQPEKKADAGKGQGLSALGAKVKE